MLSVRRAGAGSDKCTAILCMWDCPTRSKRKETTRLICGRSSWAGLDDVRRTVRGCHLERSRYTRTFEVEVPLILHHREGVDSKVVRQCLQTAVELMRSCSFSRKEGI